MVQASNQTKKDQTERKKDIKKCYSFYNNFYNRTYTASV